MVRAGQPRRRKTTGRADSRGNRKTQRTPRRNRVTKKAKRSVQRRRNKQSAKRKEQIELTKTAKILHKALTKLLRSSPFCTHTYLFTLEEFLKRKRNLLNGFRNRKQLYDLLHTMWDDNRRRRAEPTDWPERPPQDILKLIRRKMAKNSPKSVKRREQKRQRKRREKNGLQRKKLASRFKAPRRRRKKPSRKRKY